MQFTQENGCCFSLSAPHQYASVNRLPLTSLGTSGGIFLTAPWRTVKSVVVRQDLVAEFELRIIGSIQLLARLLMNKIPDKVDKIFEFLMKNKKWNKEYQAHEYSFSLASCKSKSERLNNLLHTIVNTQSAPNLNSLGGFWRNFHNLPICQEKPTLSKLIACLEGSFEITVNTDHRINRKHRSVTSRNGPWIRLFNALIAQPGWGKKTAALFVKATIKIHRETESLHFLTDSDIGKIESNDKIYLPVDSVITHIFMILNICNNNFYSINNYLHARYNNEEMLVWDDLWYWGFFTQTVQNGDRIIKWNTDKYWCQRFTSKNPKDILEIKKLGNEFIKILEDA